MILMLPKASAGLVTSKSSMLHIVTVTSYSDFYSHQKSIHFENCNYVVIFLVTETVVW